MHARACVKPQFDCTRSLCGARAACLRNTEVDHVRCRYGNRHDGVGRVTRHRAELEQHEIQQPYLRDARVYHMQAPALPLTLLTHRADNDQIDGAPAYAGAVCQRGRGAREQVVHTEKLRSREEAR